MIKKKIALSVLGMLGVGASTTPLATSCKELPKVALSIDGKEQIMCNAGEYGQENYAASLVNYEGEYSVSWELLENPKSNIFSLQINSDIASLIWNTSINQGVYKLQLKVTMAELNLEQIINIEFNVAATRAPIIYGDYSLKGYFGIGDVEGEIYTTSQENISWSLSTETSGIKINTTTGQLTWDNTLTNGTKNISITALNTATTKTATQNINLTISDLPNPTAISWSGFDKLYALKNTASTALESCIYQAMPISPQYCLKDFSYSLTGAPTGVSINNTTGEVTWDNSVPYIKAGYAFKVNAIINGQTLFQKDVTLIVYNSNNWDNGGVDSNSDLDIESPDSFGGDFTIKITEGQAASKAYYAQVDGAAIGLGNTNQNGTWSLTGSNIPVWISIDPYNGTLIWNETVTQCETEDTNQYDFSICFIPLVNENLKCEKQIKIKVKTGAKLNIINNLTNAYDSIKNKAATLISFLNTTSAKNSITTAKNLLQGITVATITLAALVNQLTSKALSSEINNQINDINSILEGMPTDINNLIATATSNGKYIPNPNKLSLATRFANDIKRSASFKKATNKANIASQILPAMSLATGVCSAFVIEAAVEVLFNYVKLVGAANNIFAID